MKKARARKGPLLLEFLEDISWKVLQGYPVVVRDMIRRRAGIYALYQKKKLYYVGLASNLTGRLKIHLRDRHKEAWDRFSVFLTADSEHIKELESLLLRIVKPEGNRVSGGFKGSKSLRGALNRGISQEDADRRASLLGGAVARRRQRMKARRGLGSEALAGVSDRAIALRAQFKGETYRARLRTDGTIRFSGKVYDSPSAAGRAVIGRGCPGWKFWKYLNEKKQWVPLQRLRR